MDFSLCDANSPTQGSTISALLVVDVSPLDAASIDVSSLDAASIRANLLKNNR